MRLRVGKCLTNYSVLLNFRLVFPLVLTDLKRYVANVVGGGPKYIKRKLEWIVTYHTN